MKSFYQNTYCIYHHLTVPNSIETHRHMLNFSFALFASHSSGCASSFLNAGFSHNATMLDLAEDRGRNNPCFSIIKENTQMNYFLGGLGEASLLSLFALYKHIFTLTALVERSSE